MVYFSGLKYPLSLGFFALGLGLAYCGPGLDLEACGIVNITGAGGHQLSITRRHAAVEPQHPAT